MIDISDFVSRFVELFFYLLLSCINTLDSIYVFYGVSMLDCIIAINILLVAIPVLINSYSSGSLERGASRDKKDSD